MKTSQIALGFIVGGLDRSSRGGAKITAAEVKDAFAMFKANDGIVSTASIVVGVAAAESSRSAILLAGIAAMAAGAMSMAAGEYVSVSSQADTERADLERERGELAADPASELAELSAIYVKRGLDPSLANPGGRRCPTTSCSTCGCVTCGCAWRAHAWRASSCSSTASSRAPASRASARTPGSRSAGSRRTA